MGLIPAQIKFLNARHLGTLGEASGLPLSQPAERGVAGDAELPQPTCGGSEFHLLRIWRPPQKNRAQAKGGGSPSLM